MFVKGLNGGYRVAKHDPELAAELIKESISGSEYFEGIVSGKQEFEREKARERLRGMNRNDIPNDDVTKNKGREK